VDTLLHNDLGRQHGVQATGNKGYGFTLFIHENGEFVY
jgi:hypothetical protein